MARHKIDPHTLREMVESGATFRDVQDLFDVTRKAVVEACIRLDVPQPKLVRAARLEADEQPPVRVAATSTAHPPRTASLIATGGRYADLAAWAKTWGVTETKARQEWHALRLPVRKGGAA